MLCIVCTENEGICMCANISRENNIDQKIHSCGRKLTQLIHSLIIILSVERWS